MHKTGVDYANNRIIYLARVAVITAALFCFWRIPFAFEAAALLAAGVRRMSTLIGLTPWQPKATSKAKVMAVAV